MIRTIKEKQLASIAAGLLILTALAYAGVRNHEFINFDDDIYVTENAMVGKGLTYKGLTWALGFNERGYWQPLTWLSHMLDCELFGLDPAGHHLVSHDRQRLPVRFHCGRICATPVERRFCRLGSGT